MWERPEAVPRGANTLRSESTDTVIGVRNSRTRRNPFPPVCSPNPPLPTLVENSRNTTGNRRSRISGSVMRVLVMWHWGWKEKGQSGEPRAWVRNSYHGNR